LAIREYSHVMPIFWNLLVRRFFLVLIVLVGALFRAQSRPIAIVGQTGTLPLACDHTVVASGGNIRITLPAATSLADGCDIVLVNEETEAGKLLIDFPADINPRLYPNQAVGITSYKGRWISTYKPGRYKIPNGKLRVLVDNDGDDRNDGISLPVKYLATAVQLVQQDFDTRQSLVTIAPTIGQTFTDDAVAVSGQPLGSNLIALSPNGNGKIKLVHGATCVTAGDNGELFLWADQYGSQGQIELHCNGANNPNTPQMLAHNNGVLDGSGRIVFYGSGDKDVAISFDGPTAGSSFNGGIQIAGRFDTVWRMEQGGGRFTLGCIAEGCASIEPIADEAGDMPSINRLFMIIGSEQLRVGNCPRRDGYRKLGPSIVGGNGLLVKFGCFIPGTPDGVPLMTQNGKVYDSAY
jgi:hypothetical protein